MADTWAYTDQSPALVITDKEHNVVYEVFDNGYSKDYTSALSACQDSLSGISSTASSQLVLSSGVEDYAPVLNATFTAVSVCCVLLGLLIGIHLTRIITSRMSR